MRTIELVVDEMRCRRCVRQATALLCDVPGIATARADSETGRITATGDITEDAVLAALADTDFTVSIRPATALQASIPGASLGIDQRTS